MTTQRVANRIMVGASRIRGMMKALVVALRHSIHFSIGSEK